jgi:hypothetical protein
MKALAKKVGAALLGLAIAAALGFGANQAVASSRTNDACTWAPPNQLGFCGSQNTCRTLCRKYAGSDQGANCINNCCFCNGN